MVIAHCAIKGKHGLTLRGWFRPTRIDGSTVSNVEVLYRPEGMYRRSIGGNFTHYINMRSNDAIRFYGDCMFNNGANMNSQPLRNVLRTQLSSTGDQSGIWFAPTSDNLVWNLWTGSGNGGTGNDWLHLSPFRPANAGGTIYNAQLMSFKRSGQAGSTTYESERASVRIMSGNVNVASSTNWDERASFVIVGQNFGVPRNGTGYNNINVWVSNTGNFGVRQPGQTSGNFRPVFASAFTVNSVRASKTHLKEMRELDETATHLIQRTQLYEYDLVQEVASNIPHKNYGVMVEEAPVEITSRTGEGIELYSMVTYAWKAIQELIEVNEKLTGRLKALERGDEIGTR